MEPRKSPITSRKVRFNGTYNAANNRISGNTACSDYEDIQALTKTGKEKYGDTIHINNKSIKQDITTSYLIASADDR